MYHSGTLLSWQGNLARCPPLILMKLKYVKEDKKNEICVFFLSAEKRFKGVKITPKVCTQKSFFFSISQKIIIFFSKTNAKIFFVKRQSRVQNCCFEGLHPLFFSNINIFFNTFFYRKFFQIINFYYQWRYNK